jgi:hypothetical protein
VNENDAVTLFGDDAANLFVKITARHVRHFDVAEDHVEAFANDDAIERVLGARADHGIVVAKHPSRTVSEP